MIKFNKKNILISLICSTIILAGSIFLFLLYQEKSSLISYSNNKKDVKINIFNKISKKNINIISLLENDPKEFILNRSINENTDSLFTFDNIDNKVVISTIDDEIQTNNQIKSGLGLIIKEIPANIGDILIFKNNELEITEELKSVYKIKDFIDGFELKENTKNKIEENLLKDQNYSFEKGLWSNTIDTCEKINDKASILSQSISNDCSDGKKCLLISSKNNTGCVSNFFTVDLKNGSTYTMSFDYKETKKESIASILFIIMGADGQNYYFTSNLLPEDSFKNFSYNITTKQNIIGFIIKLKTTGENGKESSVIFDNLKITENSKNKIIEIKKSDIVKDYSFGKMTLKEGLNEFRATSKVDSEISSNNFDYFLTFENKYQNSSFIKKIKTQETISRLSVFFIFISSLILLLSSAYLLRNLAIKTYKIIIIKLLLIRSSVYLFIKIVLRYPKNKILEIKKEKILFIILKILLLFFIFGFYIYDSISNKKEINMLSAIALFYGINSVLFVIESRVSAFVALIYLTLCPILLIMKKDIVAENMAVQAYYFLVITVITQIRENKKEEKQK